MLTLSLQPTINVAINKTKLVCCQSVINWVQAGNNIQSVTDDTANTCNKSLKIKYMCLSTKTERHD